MSLPLRGSSTAPLRLKSCNTFSSSPDFRKKKQSVGLTCMWMWHEWAPQGCKMTVIFTLHIWYDSWDENMSIILKWQSLFFPSFFGHSHFTSIMSMCRYIRLYNCKITVNSFSVIFMVIYGDGVTTLVRPTHRGEIFLKSGSDKNLLITYNSISRKCEFFSGASRRW